MKDLIPILNHFYYKKSLLLASCFFVFLSCNKNENNTSNLPTTIGFYNGLDLSFQSELETYPVDYKDVSGELISVLPFVNQNGVNIIRLRLWHSPQNGQNDLVSLKKYALKLKQNNLKFLLDIHYSDSWADPSQQNPPAEWQNLSFESLKTAVNVYTNSVMTELKNQGTSPDFVQIGNEIDSGFLWNFGKVWNQFNNNWGNYAALAQSAIAAVRTVNGTNTKIILHHSDIENAFYFFEKIQPYSIDYDVIGLSYYPQFGNKNLNLIQTKLDNLAATFGKQIMIVETAYPFSMGWQDSANNIVGTTAGLIPGYEASPLGQKYFLQKMISTLKSIPNQKGIGLIYWAPDWISFSGNTATSTGGSAWENQCLWDFDHKALPAFEAFKYN